MAFRVASIPNYKLNCELSTRLLRWQLNVRLSAVGGDARAATTQVTRESNFDYIGNFHFNTAAFNAAAYRVVFPLKDNQFIDLHAIFGGNNRPCVEAILAESREIVSLAFEQAHILQMTEQWLGTRFKNTH